MRDETKRYWFPAKRYGWGWGPPCAWQGWVVLIVWIAVLMPVSPWLASRSAPLFWLFIAGMVAVLIAVGYIKGEPPRWRWGGK